MDAMTTSVLGEAVQQAIGARTVQHLLFCTHDLEPAFFEDEVLPTFLGNDLKHTRRTRAMQLDYEIRQREVGIDVYYEGRALAAHDGAARLPWNRVVTPAKSGGVFHPKLVLALCEDDTGLESLVVCTTSANLTRGGWWTNVECADVDRIDDGERHNYVSGLVDLVDLLHKVRFPASRLATTAIRDFLQRQHPFVQRTSGGVVRPTLIPPYRDLTLAVRDLFGTRLDGTHLEVIAPFMDDDPTEGHAALSTLIEWFAPASTIVLLPTRAGVATVSQETYDAVGQIDGVAWGSLPTGYVRTSAGVEAADRALHAKVYRFWRGGSDPIEAFVVGSHNLTAAAHHGDTNAEVSVIHEVAKPRGRRFLELRTEAPDGFDAYDSEAAGVELADPLPLVVTFDWETGRATSRWTSRSKPPARIVLGRAGRDLAVVVPERTLEIEFDAGSSAALREVLVTSCVLTARTDTGIESPLLVVELGWAHKPDLLSSAALSTAEILALWSLPDLRDRLAVVGRSRTATGSDEPDLDAPATSAPPPSMFDQFAGVYHAFEALRRRVDEAVAARDVQRAAATVYGATFDTPASVLDLARAGADDDPVLPYVIFRCAELVDAYVARHHPTVAEACPEPRARLTARFVEVDGLRERLVASVPVSDQAELRRFVAWFDEQFSEDVTA